MVVVPLSERLERSHESSAWFWIQGVGLDRSTRRAVDIRVYVMLVAGWAGSGFWAPYLCVHGVCCVGLWASQ